MKPKGINLFEQHVEKIVIAVAGIIVIAIAAKAFLTQPNAVELDGERLAPTEVDEMLSAKARALDAKVKNPTSLKVESVGRLTDWFKEQHDNPATSESPSVALVAPVTYKIGSENASFVGAANEMYAEVAAPQPKNLQVTSLNYTIDPEEITALPELAERFPDGAPYDLQAVHVAAEFDGAALRTSLSGFVENRKPIPSQWVDQDMTILDVVAERQRLLPDGTWSSPEVVATIPGQLSVRDRLHSARPQEKNEILAQISTYGAAVYQPGFFSLADGTPWSYDIVRRSAPKSPELLSAEQRLQMAWRDVERAQGQLDRYLKQLGERKSTELGDGGDGKGKGSTFEGGSVNQPDEPKDASRPKETPEERNQRIKREAIAKAKEVYDTAKKDLLTLDPEYSEFPDGASPLGQKQDSVPPGGGKGKQHEIPPDGMPTEGEAMPMGMEGGGGGGKQPTMPTSKGGVSAAAVKGLFENPSIRVWSHDITAQPGGTYRYRLAVALYNPFFGRESRLTESQRGLAEDSAVLSPWTDWSAPVRVTPPQQFFAVSGIYNDRIDDRSASFEVYSFTRGEHRVMTLSVRPGEPIGEIRVVPSAEPGSDPLEIDFYTGATLLDVLQVDGGSALNQRVYILVAMPDGSIQLIDPSDRRSEQERQRLRAMATRA